MARKLLNVLISYDKNRSILIYSINNRTPDLCSHVSSHPS